MLKHILVAAFLAAAASPAFANSCPKDMAAIDAALAEKPQLSAEEMTQVKQLRAEGEALHKAGKHQELVEALHKAKEMLGI